MSERSTVKRKPERGSADLEVINSIVDEALFCHVGFVEDGAPVVIPTIHARVDRTLYLHGSPASRMLRLLKQGGEVCVAVSILDGLVLARSAFNHSMNYRSAVIFGKPRAVEEGDEQWVAFEAIANHIAPGRWDDARRPSDKEARATLTLAIDISDASAKVRTGPPVDDEEDLDLGIWAGVIPVSRHFGPPAPSPDLDSQIRVPAYLKDYGRPGKPKQ